MNQQNSDYLALIQGVISRMATNSFLIKGWSVSLTGAILTVTGAISIGGKLTELYLFGIVNIGILMAFCWLDGYFYYNEKKYREIYDYARDTSRFNQKDLFDLNPNLITVESEDKKFNARFSAMRTSAVYPVYLIQFIIILVLFIIKFVIDIT